MPTPPGLVQVHVTARDARTILNALAQYRESVFDYTDPGTQRILDLEAAVSQALFASTAREYAHEHSA